MTSSMTVGQRFTASWSQRWLPLSATFSIKDIPPDPPFSHDALRVMAVGGVNAILVVRAILPRLRLAGGSGRSPPTPQRALFQNARLFQKSLPHIMTNQ